MSTTFEYLVNKYQLDCSSGKPVEIVGVGRLDLIRWIRELDFKVGAEIGVYVGEFSRLILRGNPQFKLYLVDPWIEYKEYQELGGEDFEEMYKETARKVKTFIKKDKCAIVRKTSVDALKDFEDNSLDFVYIDANHVAPYVKQDIEGWSKKVRPGGIVSGHDYIRPRALDYAIIDTLREYTQENKIQLFVLGGKAVEPKIIRDSVRSWAFIRK